MIECKNVSMCFHDGSHDVWALKGVTLCIHDGEFVAIMGRSGSGKSTLLNVMSTLLKPTKGEIIYDGEDITKIKKKEIQKIRRSKIGFVFQQYRLIKEYSVWENICIPLTMDRKKPDEDYLNGLLKICGLEDRIECYPYQLSGGEQQRVALVRALAAKPKILFADEPTGNLDYQTGIDVIHMITAIQKKYNQTVLMVTHDHECAGYADRILVVEDGKIINL